MGYIEAYSPRDLPTSVSVAVSDLIPGDTSGLRVPLYTRNDCPEPARLRVADYLPNIGPLYFIPVYASSLMMMAPYSRPVAALTPLPTPPAS